MTGAINQSRPTAVDCFVAGQPCLQHNGVLDEVAVYAQRYRRLRLQHTTKPLRRPQPQVPEIAVEGNGLGINDGDLSPASNDHTDFGSVDAASERSLGPLRSAIREPARCNFQVTRASRSVERMLAISPC